MCGRFTLRTTASVLIEQFQLSGAPDLAPRFNIAPSQQVPVVRSKQDAAERELVMMHWGLVPSWAKDPLIGNRMINARAETAATKPSFRSAFKRRRCLVMADGYYEWQKQRRQKQPFHIQRRDQRPFAMAGLWEQWSGPSTDNAGVALQSCTIITTDANELTRPIHDRMPVILDERDYRTWIDPNVQDRQVIEPLLQPFDSEMLVAEPVSTYVNNPRNEDPKCIEVQPELF
jgi:putative SOS response-associated peptidase YedK